MEWNESTLIQYMENIFNCVLPYNIDTLDIILFVVSLETSNISTSD